MEHSTQILTDPFILGVLVLIGLFVVSLLTITRIVKEQSELL